MRPIETWLTDMDGVLVHEEEPIAGAQEFIAALREADVPFLVLTNNSIYTPRDLRVRLLRSGIEVPEESIWTSALATAQFLSDQRPGGSAYVVGEAGLTTALHDVGYVMTERDPDYVVLGETRTYSFESITRAIRLINDGARFLATNPDPSGPSPQGMLPATGSVAALISTATGQTPYFIGKPNPLMMRSALNRLEAHSGDHGHGGRPHGHRHHQRARGRHADRPRLDRLDPPRPGRPVPLPADDGRRLDRRPGADGEGRRRGPHRAVTWRRSSGTSAARIARPPRTVGTRNARR